MTHELAKIFEALAHSVAIPNGSDSALVLLKVNALVDVAAFMPEVGETSLDASHMPMVSPPRRASPSSQRVARTVSSKAAAHARMILPGTFPYGLQGCR